MMVVAGNAFDGGFQQGDYPALAVGIGWRGFHANDLWRLQPPDTSSKVTHQSAAGRSSPAPQPPPIVNNFAGTSEVPVDNFPAPVSDRQRKRPRLDTVTNPQSLEDLEKKTGPDGGSSPRSDRTKAREAHRISSTGGGIGCGRTKSETTKAMKTHQELTHFAGFDWAKDHHDIVIVDAQGRIVSEFRIEHSLTG
jgi:hypothetical protein